MFSGKKWCSVFMVSFGIEFWQESFSPNMSSLREHPLALSALHRLVDLDCSELSGHLPLPASRPATLPPSLAAAYIPIVLRIPISRSELRRSDMFVDIIEPNFNKLQRSGIALLVWIQRPDPQFPSPETRKRGRIMCPVRDYISVDREGETIITVPSGTVYAIFETHILYLRHSELRRSDIFVNPIDQTLMSSSGAAC